MSKVSEVEVVRQVLSFVDLGLKSNSPLFSNPKEIISSSISDNFLNVSDIVRSFNLALSNGYIFWTPSERSRMMRRLAVAQLGSSEIDQQSFNKIFVEETIRQILPLFLQDVAKLHSNHSKEINEVVLLLEQNPSIKSAFEAALMIKNIIKIKDDRHHDHPAKCILSSIEDIIDSIIESPFADCTMQAIFNLYDYFPDTRNLVLKISAQIAEATLIRLESTGCDYLYLCE